MDHIKDQSCRHLNRLNLLTDVPNYVKSASLADEDVAGLPDHLFADPANREFPINEKGHIYLSHAYMKSAGLSKPAVAQRVMVAARLAGIEQDIQKLNEIFDNQNKSASAEEYRAAISIMRDGADAPELFYPLNTVTDVEDTIQKLASQRHRIPLPLFTDACRNIVKAAAVLGMSDNQVPRLIKRYGEERIVDVCHVKFAAERRVKVTGDELYLDISEAVAASGGEEDMDKYAELWLKTDLSNDVEYDSIVEDPYEIIYSGTTKAAADKYLDQFFLLAGAPVPVAEFSKLSQASINKHFPKGEAADLIELVKVAAAQGGAALEQSVGKLNYACQHQLLSLIVRDA